MRILFVLLILSGVLLTATPAVAAEFLPLVTCGGPDQSACTPCDLFQTFKRTIDFVLVGLTGPVAAFMVVLAGGMMLLAGGKPAMFAQGQRLLTNTLMGVAVILLAWAATNFLIKSLGEGSGDDPWYAFSCPDFLVGVGEEGAVGPPAAPESGPGRPPAALVEANQQVCGDESALAASFGLTAAVKQKNAPELDQLIDCIKRDSVVITVLDQTQLFTYEQRNPLCNLTRGFPVCGGRCAHSKYSCHYGGRSGTAGALGVDFNWNKKGVTYNIKTRVKVSDDPEMQKTECFEMNAAGKKVNICRSVGSEAQLFDEIYCAAVKNRCAFGLLNFEGDHTHMSTTTCDVDAHDGLKGRSAPEWCK